MGKVRTFTKNLFMFVSSHRKLVLGLTVMALILIVSVFIYVNNKKSTEVNPVIYTTYSDPGAELAPYIVLDAAKANGKTISNNDANDIARLINRSASSEKPYAHSITTDKTIADAQAGEIAKDRKADLIIKQTSENKQASNDKINMQDNNYYIIQQERKHSVAVGIADVDNDAYITASYRNRKTEVTGYYNPSTGKTGAGVSYQISRW